MSSDLALIIDIRHSIALIEQYIGDLSQTDFEGNPLRRDATAFRLLLIGEAAKHLSPEVTTNLPEIASHDIPALSAALASL